jgi:Fe-S-cluster containining protein
VEQPDALQQLERQVERGSFFMQASLDEIAGRTSGVEGFVIELVEVLRAKGVLADDDLRRPGSDTAPAVDTAAGADTAPEVGSAPEVDTAPEAGPAEEPEELGPPDAVAGATPPPPPHWPGIALRVEGEQLAPPAQVNCAERMHICHAVCCKLNFALTAEEVDAGKVKWDLGFPYIIRHDADGLCTHNDRATGGCGVYADRPGICRRYSCANDRRIWKDFERMELNSEWLDEHVSEPTRIRLRMDLPLMQATEPPAQD